MYELQLDKLLANNELWQLPYTYSVHHFLLVLLSLHFILMHQHFKQKLEKKLFEFATNNLKYLNLHARSLGAMDHKQKYFGTLTWKKESNLRTAPQRSKKDPSGIFLDPRSGFSENLSSKCVSQPAFARSSYMYKYELMKSAEDEYKQWI